jgi:hypothetical protein
MITETPLNAQGWIIMLSSTLIVTGTFVWCLWKILTAPKD